MLFLSLSLSLYLSNIDPEIQLSCSKEILHQECFSLLNLECVGYSILISNLNLIIFF